MKARHLAATVVAVAVGLSACASSDPHVRVRSAKELSTTAPSTTESPFNTTVVPPSTTEPVEPASTLPNAGGPEFTMPADKPPQPYDDYLEAAINDILNFWRNEYPAVYGSPYTELAGGVHPMYPGAPLIQPGCGQPSDSFDDVVGNAYYCHAGAADFIAYDDAQLLPDLVADLGASAVGVVLAHEWGHAIQTRAGYDDQTIYLEQQADCFAGAWLAHVGRGESAELSFSDADLRSALRAMIMVRDQPGSLPTDDLAHGSAFDRVGAFEDGFINGSEKCAGYPKNKPTPLQFGYTAELDQENAPLEDPSGAGADIFSIATKTLNTYWPTVVTSMPELTVEQYTGDPRSACDVLPDSIFAAAFYCAGKQAVEVDSDSASAIWNDVDLGDTGVIYVVGTAWAEAVMDLLGSTVAGEDRALAADCMVGSYIRSLLPPEFNPDTLQDETGVNLSPGDLDEAVSTAIAASDETPDLHVNGTAFDKTASFRTGVLQGFDACRPTLGI